MDPTLTWLPDGSPYSPLYGDVYSTRSGALAQARNVFLGGCGLPALWQGREHCRILETGFGLGMNFLTTWAAWQSDRRRSTSLSFVSTEAHPVTTADLLQGARALRPGDAQEAALLLHLQRLAGELAAASSGLRPGLQHWDFDAGRVRLSLGVGEVLAQLPGLPGPADAVYLDGFSPARNPAMWSAPVIDAVARQCRPGALLASWCVAGEVRQRLQQAGFEVRKAPGLPPKRHRLEATYRGAVPVRPGSAAA